MRRAYLDHASSSPLRPAALEAMLPYLREHHADPGRVYHEGKVTRVAIEVAREQVASFVGARPREVVFTSSGTEAVNAAIWGAVTRATARAGVAVHVVTTAIEHSSVTDSLERLACDVTAVGVDRLGRVDADEIAAVIRQDTALVSVQLANHEVGTVPDISALVAAIRSSRAPETLVHVDACAAVGHLDLDFAELGIDLCSITAHKLGGPKGSGALLVRRGLRVPPLLVGGAQERARRGGIENIPAIVGFGAAVTDLGPRLGNETARARALTDRIVDGSTAIDGVAQLGDPHCRLPHLVCLATQGVEAEPVLLGLDQRGVAVHSGSSCSSEALEPSPVLRAMGVDAERSLRVSVGWDTTDADVTRFLDALPEVLGSLRSLR